MSMTEVGVATPRIPARYVEWGAVIAGAIGAAAISFLLLTFGGAIGLSMTSAWADRGVSATVLAWAVAWWSVLVQIGSFAAGGYLAGRMRGRWGDSISSEGQFRDGAHGFLVWAVGVLVGALALAVTSGSVLSTAVQTAGTVAGGAAAGASNKATELAMGPRDYAVDLLLRPASGSTAQATGASTSTPGADAGTTPTDPAAGAAAGTTRPQGAQQRDDASLRSEIARIYATSITNREITARDRDYLTDVVTARTGLPRDQAQQRVDASIKEAQDYETKARAAADKARKAGVVTAFLTAASLLISLGAACAGAALGGRHRDENQAPLFFGRRFW